VGGTLIRAAAWLLATAWCGAAASETCAKCHREIYESYRQTPMAMSAGAAGDGLKPAAFTHGASGFRYRIGRNGFEFAKSDGSLRGSKRFAYFVGSGATARSYLIADDGWLFLAPVAWYARGGWGLGPSYDTYAYPYLTRPVMPACLTCHASFLAPVAGTQNRYEAAPFREGGVACERCHGPGEAHVRGGAAIVNPAKLAPANRDSICAQCHLSGAVRVMAAGKGWDAFHPGERLSDSMTVFVKAGGVPGVTVTGHVEKLQQSACKRVAGDRLWCGTCHDPHKLPKPEERAAWFRGKCLGCHAAEACKESKPARTARRDDCTACHMPKNTAVDAQHVVYTDHSIPRRPRSTPAAPRPDAELVAFGGGTASDRDLALAYAIAAPRERSAVYRARALEMLQQVERRSPEDTEVLLYLAELYRNGDQPDRAIPLYERAMRLDAAQVTASVGLGGIRMERGEFAEAIRLWEAALAKNAGLELVRLNLAMAYWRAGDRASAQRHLEKAVALSPGFASAVELLQKVR
jgi:hypothetical protein